MNQMACTPAVFLTLAILGAGTALGQDTVRVGSRILEGAALGLGRTSMESFKLHRGVRTPVSRSIQTIERAVEDGTPVYRITTLHWAVGGGDSAVTTIVVRQKDFALLRHKVKADRDSAVVVYSRGYLSGWVVLPNEPVLLIDMKASQPVFPVDGPAPWLWTVLPLKENFHAFLPRYSMWEKGEVVEEVSVLGTETVEHHGKSVECWKVDNGPFAIPGYRAYRWVDKSTMKVVQSVLRGNGKKPEYWSVAE